MGCDDLHAVCNTGLRLGLGSDHHPDHLDSDHQENKKKSIKTLKYDQLLPSDLTLGPVSAPPEDHDQKHRSPERFLHRQASSLSAASSFSNSSASTTVVKRDRDMFSGEEAETDHLGRSRAIGRNTDHRDDRDQDSPRKKLRLTKQQSALLEDSFKEHATLNPRQKQDLASQLNLRPRQVEVWFQNRRARTKLKQTEADYEQWKKCCETLTEENKRLQKELQELKSLRLITTTPFYVPFATSPPATLTVCPSCERIDRAGVKPPHLISANSFTSNQHPSAAC